MSSPTVSINLCCYNSEKYLEETLRSIFAQTYKDWELVIINDGSTDSTESIIKKYINRGYPIIYHWQENHGLGYSRNEALKRSSGKYIAFIDHDDLWRRDKLEKQLPLFNDPEVGLVYSDTIFFNEAGKEWRLYSRCKHWGGYCFEKLLTNYFLSLETVVLRRAALKEEALWFDSRFNMVEEADLFTRIAFKWKLEMLDEPLSKWRVHNASLSWAKGFLYTQEMELMLENLKKMIPDFTTRYVKAISIVEQNLAVEKAVQLWKNDDGRLARNTLSPFIRVNKRAFMVYLASFLPQRLIMAIKYRLGGIAPS